MTRREVSYQLSSDLVRVVRKRYFMDAYGIKNCGDPMVQGDIYDLYLRKDIVDSTYDCDIIFKTNN